VLKTKGLNYYFGSYKTVLYIEYYSLSETIPIFAAAYNDL
jgi:hypothetical protein